MSLLPGACFCKPLFPNGILPIEEYGFATDKSKTVKFILKINKVK